MTSARVSHVADVPMPAVPAPEGRVCSSEDGPFCFPITGRTPPMYLQELREAERNMKENAVRAGMAPDTLEAILSTVAERLRNRGDGKLLAPGAVNGPPPGEFRGAPQKEGNSPPEARIIVMMEEEGDDGRVRMQNREFVFTQDDLGKPGDDIETMKHRLRTKLRQLGANVPEELLHHVVRGFQDESAKQQQQQADPTHSADAQVDERQRQAAGGMASEGRRNPHDESKHGSSSVLQLQDRLRMLRQEHEITMQQRRARRPGDDDDDTEKRSGHGTEH